MGLENFRRNVGTVMQEDMLFTGSIADNIAFFDTTPSPERIIFAATQAAIHDEILALPMGYDSLIGDSGAGISGGQKQRLLLARALYAEPCLLLLDEATSHLDLHNERTVNQAVKELKLTRIIIAHRPETIAMADRVIVMEKGRVVRDTRQLKQSAADEEAAYA
jgi:ATP-binding cassette subfamily B protein RaxB